MDRVGTCALTLAAMAGLIALTGCADDSRSARDGFGPSGGATQRPTEPTTTPSPSEASDGAARTVYYLGPGPDGPDGQAAALYRSLEGPSADNYDTGSVLDLLTAAPSDPDYRTMWPRGSIRSVGDPEMGESVVKLASSVPRNRPAGMTPWEAELALQQVVYSVRAYYQADVDIQFTFGDAPSAADQVLGVETPGGFVQAAPQLDVLSHMNISDPVEGLRVSGSFTARGRSNGFEGTVACYLTPAAGGEAVWSDAGIASGYEDRLFPWEMTVDLNGVPSGAYTFWCSTDDPTGGTEGAGAYVDTRTVVVE